MRPVGVAQELHAMIGTVGYNDVAGGIESDTNRIIKLSGGCTERPDGPQKGAIAVAKNLDAMIAAVSNNHVSLFIKRDAALALQLSWAAASDAQAPKMLAITQAKHLNATVDVAIVAPHAAVRIDSDATRFVQFIAAAAFPTDGANMRGV